MHFLLPAPFLSNEIEAVTEGKYTHCRRLYGATGTPTINELQAYVGAGQYCNVDCVRLWYDEDTQRDVSMWVHDEGLLLHLPQTIAIRHDEKWTQPYVGNCVFSATDMNDGESVPMNRYEAHKLVAMFASNAMEWHGPEGITQVLDKLIDFDDLPFYNAATVEATVDTWTILQPPDYGVNQHLPHREFCTEYATAIKSQLFLPDEETDERYERQTAS